MTLRIGTFNTENLFRRPRIFKAGGDGGDADAQHQLEDYALLVRLLEHDPYTEADKKEILRIIQHYEVTDPHSRTRPFLLNEVRGKLCTTHRDGRTEVTAKGRHAWVGWLQLVRDDIDREAVENTARVIAEVNADILLTVEVEDRPALQRFSDQLLDARLGAGRYPYNMLIDGNDTRGIDVGLLSRLPVTAVRSHIFDRENGAGEPVFSRDCPESEIRLPGGESLWILGNHFKSKGYGSSADSARRRAQAGRVTEIYRDALTRSPYVVVAGDLNDTPDSAPIRLLTATGLRDAMSHPSYTGRPGTYASGNTLNQKIDYLLLSPALWDRLRAVDAERRGVWAPHSIEPFPTVTSAITQASDHAALFMDLDL
jgi:endonuclease/exonuclease/phosphatase family metal-dependent hydrolase